MCYYTEKFKIYSFNCNKDKYAKLEYLFQTMIETSIKQTNENLTNINNYKDYFWVIYQWDVDIFNRPKYNEEIIVETVSAGANKFYAYRNFTISDKNGKIYIKAKSKWLLLNKNRKMPLRITNKILEIYGSDENQEKLENEFEVNSNLEFKNNLEFRVRKSDIDLNNHVNNAKYLNWILENIEEDNKVNKIELIYKKETKYGTDIISESTNIQKELKNNIVYNRIIDIDGNIKTLAKIHLGV